MSAVLKRHHQDLDEQLEAWARWRRRAARPPTGGYHNPLAGLVAEGATIGRGTAGQIEAEALLESMRRAVGVQIAMLSACLAGLMDDTSENAVARRAQLADQLKRLKSARARIPRSAANLAWASLIHGAGHRPDPESPEEERVDRAVEQLVRPLRRVIYAEYLTYGTQDMRARRADLSLATFKRRLNEALKELHHLLTT